MSQTIGNNAQSYEPSGKPAKDVPPAGLPPQKAPAAIPGKPDKWQPLSPGRPESPAISPETDPDLPQSPGPPLNEPDSPRR